MFCMRNIKLVVVINIAIAIVSAVFAAVGIVAIRCMLCCEMLIVLVSFEIFVVGDCVLCVWCC